MYNLLYEVVEENSNGQTSYGIEILENGIKTKYIPNVFKEKELTEKLVNKCNTHRIPPIHILDLIEDAYFDLGINKTPEFA